MIKVLKAFIERHFKKHPLIGYALLGFPIGVLVTCIGIILALAGFEMFGICRWFDIGYKTWLVLAGIFTGAAMVFFIYGMIQCFLLPRRGNYVFLKLAGSVFTFPYHIIKYLLFRKKGSYQFKTYTKGTSYRALHQFLIQHDGNEEG